MKMSPSSASGSKSSREITPVPSAGFLEGLPEESISHGFANIHIHEQMRERQQNLYQNKTENQFLIYSNVPYEVIQQLDEDRIVKGSRISYDLQTKALVIKIVASEAHEMANRLFELLLYEKLGQMGLPNSLNPPGSARRHFGDFVKEPDSSWGPAPLPGSPLVLSAVLEVGLSESARRLEADSRRWIEAKDSSVRLAIAMDIDQRSPKISIEVWERVSQSPPRKTRAYRATAAKVLQVDISRLNGTTTANANLILSFRNLLLRPADPANPLEHDIDITPQDLESLAEDIWKAQGFIP
jgi:hypothetical protein